jgi:beta-phosphoglucomutase-like phosphatase (HAD superfamily)
MTKALILDYNGVLVNDEPLHMRAFREVLAREGLPLAEEEYFTRYLGLPDADIARDALRRAGALSEEVDDRVDHLLARKAFAFRELVRRDLPEVPGAREFVLAASARWPIAVASGAFRVEVEDGLYRLGVRDAVTSVITIENVRRGKPDPEILLAARASLLRIDGAGESGRRLLPDEPTASFLVIEDSPAGLAAARAAWMPAIGVATSRPAADLIPSLFVVPDLRALDLDTLSTG